MASPKLDCTLPINTAHLKDKSIFVTGGADGIGAGLVRRLAAAGAYVTFGDINNPKGEQLQDELKVAGYKTNFVTLDVTSWPSQVSAFTSALAFPPSEALDAVFLNAGIVSPPLLEPGPCVPDAEPKDPALQVYAVNLLGTVRGASLALHHFERLSASAESGAPAGKRAIILTGSLASYLESPGTEMYGSSKFGVRGVFKNLRSSLPARGVRINMVAPTYLRTALLSPETASRVEAMGIVPTSIDHVVSAMLRLACDDSINGRSVGIGPNGAFDFGDDWEGHDGFLALRKFVEDGALGEGAVGIMKAVPSG